MKKPKRITVILYGLCAVIWTVRVIAGVANREYEYNAVFLIFHVLTALIWIAAFVRWMLKYRSEKTDSDF